MFLPVASKRVSQTTEGRSTNRVQSMYGVDIVISVQGCGLTVSVLQGKRVLLGVTGGISAYKAVEVLRLLTKAGAIVDVVMTPDATRFVTPATFRGLSGRPVIVDLHQLPPDLESTRATMPHLDVAEGADLAIVAPATANTMARMSYGLADNALVATLLSVTAPVIVAPAMDSDMWRHPATQENVRRLKERGVHFVGPEEGPLARMNVGPGRLAQPQTIVAKAKEVLSLAQPEARDSLKGYRVLVTAGGTREPLDPVRYIGNRSSGRMGYALAQQAAAQGANVTLVTAPSALEPPHRTDVVRIETALEMYRAVEERLDVTDVVIMAAAVADYRPETTFDQKVKKGSGTTWDVRLVRNPDIAAMVGQRKRHDQLLVAFAAETERLVEHATEKLKKKNADMIVANDVAQEGSGFEVDTNQVTLIYDDGTKEELPLLSKVRVAQIIIERVADLMVRRKA